MALFHLCTHHYLMPICHPRGPSGIYRASRPRTCVKELFTALWSIHYPWRSISKYIAYCHATDKNFLESRGLGVEGGLGRVWPTHAECSEVELRPTTPTQCYMWPSRGFHGWRGSYIEQKASWPIQSWAKQWRPPLVVGSEGTLCPVLEVSVLT